MLHPSRGIANVFDIFVRLGKIESGVGAEGEDNNGSRGGGWLVDVVCACCGGIDEGAICVRLGNLESGTCVEVEDNDGDRRLGCSLDVFRVWSGATDDWITFHWPGNFDGGAWIGIEDGNDDGGSCSRGCVCSGGAIATKTKFG
jgi:hypothetical protein